TRIQLSGRVGISIPASGSGGPADNEDGPAGTRDLARALGKVVGGGMRVDSYTRHLYSRDASMYAIEPLGVVFPRDAAEAAGGMSTAAAFGVPVLPRGAGTSLAGQTVGRAVVMDSSRHTHPTPQPDPEPRPLPRHP